MADFKQMRDAGSTGSQPARRAFRLNSFNMEAAMKAMMLAAMVTILVATPVLGACPALVPADSAEAIRNNQDRIGCLQREAATDAERKTLEMKLRALEANQQRLEMERRLQVLQTIKPPPIPAI
ncbi:hypothetical protein [Devosia ginsengisoli]|uniref:hypothetical protein n=1 Tax=Devosia ginsengisoli TaxID=400770 RepID=UPI0026E973DB|nr:hypothetical protein [Devosia ginsengisoli]MCR6672839.1 hypothetical protein [Devosia ginsengisoli]